MAFAYIHDTIMQLWLGRTWRSKPSSSKTVSRKCALMIIFPVQRLASLFHSSVRLATIGQRLVLLDFRFLDSLWKHRIGIDDIKGVIGWDFKRMTIALNSLNRPHGFLKLLVICLIRGQTTRNHLKNHILTLRAVTWFPTDAITRLSEARPMVVSRIVLGTYLKSKSVMGALI